MKKLLPFLLVVATAASVTFLVALVSCAPPPAVGAENPPPVLSPLDELVQRVVAARAAEARAKQDRVAAEKELADAARTLLAKLRELDIDLGPPTPPAPPKPPGPPGPPGPSDAYRKSLEEAWAKETAGSPPADLAFKRDKLRRLAVVYDRAAANKVAHRADLETISGLRDVMRLAAAEAGLITTDLSGLRGAIADEIDRRVVPRHGPLTQALRDAYQDCFVRTAKILAELK